MRMSISVDIEYQIYADQAVLLTIEAAQTEGQRVLDSAFAVDNASLQRMPGEGGVGERVWAFATDQRFIVRYRAMVEVDRADVDLNSLAADPMHTLPGAVLTYLRPSRYCQSDLFTEFVADQFGSLAGGAKIAAILDWIANAIAYVPGSSSSTTTAIDTFNAGQGVCRDFAHLVCSLARAANIPARYVAVYGADVSPPDFHAVVQVWLAGAWHLIDATRMSCATGLVIIGSGRDAGDVAFMEAVQAVQPVSVDVRVSRV